MAKNNSEEINFQNYIDGVKQKEISWKFFVDFIQDLSYSDKNRLRILNAMLLKELTMNFSDIEKLKYLNEILLIQFKKYIQKVHEFEMTENDHHEAEALQDSNVDHALNAKTFVKTSLEISTNENIEMPIVNEIKEDLNSSFEEEIIECNPSENNQKIFLCDICNKEYKMYFYMKQHIKNVHEQKKSFKFQNNLVHNEHKIDEKKLTIKSMSNQTNNLKMHIHNIHEVQQDYKCEYCGKLFPQAEFLKKHIYIVHSGQKDKSFPHEEVLKRHYKKFHKGHKDYKCGCCGKSFPTAGNLKRHIYTVHKGNKDYKCDSCGKSFTQMAALEEHLHTIHDGYRDHKCESCGKSFSHAGYLKKHIQTVHEGRKDYKCDSCNKSFSHAHHLKKHINTNHLGHKN